MLRSTRKINKLLQGRMDVLEAQRAVEARTKDKVDEHPRRNRTVMAAMEDIYEKNLKTTAR